MRLKKKLQRQAAPIWLELTKTQAILGKKKKKKGGGLSLKPGKCQRGWIWGSGAISAPHCPCGYQDASSHNSGPPFLEFHQKPLGRVSFGQPSHMSIWGPITR